MICFLYDQAHCNRRVMGIQMFFFFVLCLKHFKMSECGEGGESDSRDIFVFHSTQSNLRFKFSV